MALKYRAAMEQVESLTGTRVRLIHALGGASRNRVLCQLTADACGRPVLVGPVEPTALGNVLTQAMSRGEMPDLAAAHAPAAAPTTIDVYEPAGTGYREELYGRLRAGHQTP